MLAAHRAPRGFTLPAGALVAAFLLQSFVASRIKSPVFDETGDIAAGLSYLRTGQVRANLQHPPLLKELAALPLFLSGMRLPDTPETRQMLSGGGMERDVGSTFIAQNGADRVMFLARLPMILLAGLLGVLIYAWGRKVVGDLAALGALFLYAFDPTVLVHSYLATMDAGLAAFTVLFLCALWRYLHHPGLKSLLVCGLALGGLLSTKFSAMFLVPVAAVLLLAALPPGFRSRLSGACAFLAICLVATLVIQVLYLSPGGLYLYSTGLQQLNADHDPNYLVYMAGRMDHHFTSYFAAAYLLKEPIACILLVGLGLVAVLRSRGVTVLGKLFLLVPPVVLFGAHTIWADDLGIRYIIPALPFLYLIGGVGLARLIKNGVWSRALAAVLSLWMLVAAAGIYPDHLSYFNEAACFVEPSQIGFDGGTRCGPLWLDDSNVDWGQSLKQLKSWMDQHAGGRTIHLGYFGSFPPEAYGIHYEKTGFTKLMEPPAPGLYAVSAHWVARLPALGPSQWLRNTPTAIIAHSLYVYDIPPE